MQLTRLLFIKSLLSYQLLLKFKQKRRLFDIDLFYKIIIHLLFTLLPVDAKISRYIKMPDALIESTIVVGYFSPLSLLCGGFHFTLRLMPYRYLGFELRIKYHPYSIQNVPVSDL